MAGTYNIKTKKGSDVSATFTFTGLNIVSTMTPTAHLRKTAASETLAAVFTTAQNNASSPNGTITITLEGTKTAPLAAGEYVYDLKVDDSADNSSVIYVEGKVILNEAVTR